MFVRRRGRGGASGREKYEVYVGTVWARCGHGSIGGEAASEARLHRGRGCIGGEAASGASQQRGIILALVHY
mgnify:CR=1